jgi:hypothetical protein
VLSRVVVVGASLAGLRTAETLRGEGYAGPLTLIGAETHMPYDRRALSKNLLPKLLRLKHLSPKHQPRKKLPSRRPSPSRPLLRHPSSKHQ